MAPFTLQRMVNTDDSERFPLPDVKDKENGSAPAHSASTPTAAKTIPTAAPTHEEKNFRDILSYEDKWIGWDGLVWCKRYGRFENKAQAAEDDGYESDSPVIHRDPELHQIHQCQQEGCAGRVPLDYRSYVKDIQRRLEPMTASLVVLEHQVAKLIHGIVKDGEHAIHDAFNNEDGRERFALHSAGRHEPDGPMHAEHFEKRRETKAETVAKLEAKVHSLTHQLHVLVKQNDELIRNSQVGPGEHQHYWQVSQ